MARSAPGSPHRWRRGAWSPRGSPPAVRRRRARRAGSRSRGRAGARRPYSGGRRLAAGRPAAGATRPGARPGTRRAGPPRPPGAARPRRPGSPVRAAASGASHGRRALGRAIIRVGEERDLGREVPLRQRGVKRGAGIVARNDVRAAPEEADDGPVHLGARVPVEATGEGRVAFPVRPVVTRAARDEVGHAGILARDVRECGARVSGRALAQDRYTSALIEQHRTLLNAMPTGYRRPGGSEQSGGSARWRHQGSDLLARTRPGIAAAGSCQTSTPCQREDESSDCSDGFFSAAVRGTTTRPTAMRAMPQMV